MNENRKSVASKFFRLMAQVNILLVSVAILIVCVLIIVYFIIGSLEIETPSLNQKLSTDLSMGLITNLIPVFLIFLGSWFFIKEIRKLEKEDDRKEFATETATYLLAGIKPHITNIESSLKKEIRTFSGFNDGIVDLLNNDDDNSKIIKKLDVYAMSAGTFMDNLLHGNNLKDTHMRILLPTARAIEVYYSYYSSMVSKDPSVAVSMLHGQIGNTESKLRSFKNHGNLSDFEIRYVDTFPTFYMAILDGISNLFGYYYVDNLEKNYGLTLGPVNVLHSIVETVGVSEANKKWFDGLWDSAHNDFQVKPIKYFTTSAYTKGAKTCLREYYDLAAESFEKSYEGFSLKKDDFSLIINQDLEHLKDVFLKDSNGDVLDAGCGPAFWISYYKNRASSITLLDVSKRMLDAARSRVEVLKDDINVNVDFVECDLLNLEIDRHKKYNTILLSFVLSHYTDNDIKIILEKLSNLLVSSGTIMVIDSMYSDYVKIRNDKEILKSLVGSNAIQVYKRYFEIDEMIQLAENNGFICSNTYTGNFFSAFTFTR